jgi:hypothetical protein
VIVEGHARDPRFGDHPVDTHGVIAVAAEQAQRRVDQVVAFRRCHGASIK